MWSKRSIIFSLMWSLLVCLSVVAVCAADFSMDSRVVVTNHGPIRGYKDPDGSLFSFYDVPYATAPRGRDKFKAPLPPPIWTEPFEAVHRDIACPQLDDASSHMNIQEDCLVANIFVPDIGATNLSVVVDIHGGGFALGYSGLTKLKNLVRNYNIIVVSFNYRLLAYGFLCLGTKNVPGNAGMKDQVALLRWVNKNIESFGGNRNDVTIMGCSSGGASVDLLMLSNMTNGLFRKAIIGSGCAYGGVALQYNPIQNAKNYASFLNFTDVDDLEALEEFYISTPYEILVSRQMNSMERLDSGLIFAVCVERDVGVEMFLNDDPTNILRNGNFPAIPLLYGLTNDEGLFRLPMFDTWSHMMNNKFSDFLPLELQFDNKEQKDQVTQTVKSFYFGDKPVDRQTILGYIDFNTDVLFGYRVLKALTLRLATKKQPIYLYYYTFVDENTPVIPYTANIRGASHCDQMYALYDENEANATEAYKNMKKTVRLIWKNFITTGNPVPFGSSLPKWPATNITASPYLDLGSVIQLKDSIMGARFQLWDDIFDKYYMQPKRPIAISNNSESFRSNVFVISILTMCSFTVRFTYLI